MMAGVYPGWWLAGTSHRRRGVPPCVVSLSVFARPHALTYWWHRCSGLRGRRKGPKSSETGGECRTSKRHTDIYVWNHQHFRSTALR